MKKLYPRVALLAALAVAPLAAAADAPVLERIVQNGEIRIGMSTDQAPLNMKDRTGELMGLEVDLAMLLAEAFQVRLSVVEKPFPDLLPALRSGEVDMVMSGMSITAERAVEVTFVGPYVMSGKSLVTKSRLLAGAQEAEDLNESDIRLVALQDSTSQQFVERYVKNAKLTKTRDYSSAVKMVLSDEADAMVADMPVCQLTLLRHPQDNLVTLDQPLTIEPIGIAILPNDPQFKSLLENYLAAIRNMGVLEILRARWFEDGSWVVALP